MDEIGSGQPPYGSGAPEPGGYGAEPGGSGADSGFGNARLDSGFGDPAPASRGRSRAVKAAAFVGAGVLAGAVGVAALHSSNASAGTNAAAQTTQQGAGVPGAGGLPGDPNGSGTNGSGTNGSGGADGGALPGGGLRGFGGVPGETRVIGTVSAVSGSSVTVKAADGATASYAVTATTQIRRNGTTAALTDLQVGDPVLVHVLPGTGSGTAERIMAGTFAGGRGGFGPPAGQTAPGQTAPDQTAPGQSGGTATGTTTTLT